jgi:hypothetical protein
LNATLYGAPKSRFPRVLIRVDRGPKRLAWIYTPKLSAFGGTIDLSSEVRS